MKELIVPNSDYDVLKYFIGLPKDVKSKVYRALKKVPMGFQPKALVDFVSEAQLNNKQEQSVSILLNNAHVGDLPINLNYLSNSITKSKFVLNLKDNWDDEGSISYNETTLVSAPKFIISYDISIYKHFNLKIDAPNIYPGPKGSIDILWEFEKYRLLINVDKNGEDAMFYADNNENQNSEGHFQISNFLSSLIPIPVS